MKPLILKYTKPADDSAEGWEKYSLPIGNGYMGANIFGRTDRERIQITENSLENPGNLGGLNNFAEIYIHFNHNNVTDYERKLTLNSGIAGCSYKNDDIFYSREYFTSYPDKVLVVKLTSSKKGALSFKLKPVIPYIKEFAKEEGDGGKKSGKVFSEGDTITLAGKMEYYNISFEGQLRIIPERGKLTAVNPSGEDGYIEVQNADSAVIIMAVGTNYELSEEVFLQNDPKKKIPDKNPHEKVSRYLNEAASRSYETLLQNHLKDFQGIFGRVSLDLGGEVPECPTDILLEEYKKGKISPYLEALFFQYGRYLLICSSRKGTLPCNLQGIWNCHDMSPWGSGYWHNINVQMNYWPVFNTNMAELFEAYLDFNLAYRPCAEKSASSYIKKQNPENYIEEQGECGWTIGTASYPYTISGPGGHSGPGTGGLTTKLFWDYFDFTRDEEVLKKITYPSLESMSKFLTKTVKNYDGFYLASFSASPEQMIPGRYSPKAQYYHTVGCAFDQQMIYENGSDYIKASDICGLKSPVLEIQKAQLDKYNPVEVGLSGQIKEYSEENFYGEIGEYNHRHISQLVALYPGTLINSETPAWLDAAKTTLNERGDQSTGWAMAHRLNSWARTGDGNRAYHLYKTLLQKGIMPNLWDTHPPFQIDGNLGGTAGVAEMLLQSHEGYISILPAVPDSWGSGFFSGLVARGNFEISVKWQQGQVISIGIKANKGGLCKLKYYNLSTSSISDSTGSIINFMSEDNDKISFNSKIGESYTISNINPYKKVKAPENLEVSLPGLRLSWVGGEGLLYNVYKAIESEAKYTKIASAISDTFFVDKETDFSKINQCTYKVTAIKVGEKESDGPTKTINHATQLDLDRYHYLTAQLNK